LRVIHLLSTIPFPPPPQGPVKVAPLTGAGLAVLLAVVAARRPSPLLRPRDLIGQPWPTSVPASGVGPRHPPLSSKVGFCTASDAMELPGEGGGRPPSPPPPGGLGLGAIVRSLRPTAAPGPIVRVLTLAAEADAADGREEEGPGQGRPPRGSGAHRGANTQPLAQKAAGRAWPVGLAEPPP